MVVSGFPCYSFRAGAGQAGQGWSVRHSASLSARLLLTADRFTVLSLPASWTPNRTLFAFFACEIAIEVIDERIIFFVVF